MPFTRWFCAVALVKTYYPVYVHDLQVTLPIFVVDYDSPTHLLHTPTTSNMIDTEDSGHWIPPTPYNARYENCNSALMPRRRVSSSFFDSSSLPDLSTSLSIAASGGSGSLTMQRNPSEHLIDEEEPIGVDEGRHEESLEDYEELRSWLDCVATSGDVARLRRADRLAPRLSAYGIESLDDIVDAKKGSWSTSWYQGVWPPAAASSTCAPEIQENVLPDEETSKGKEQREESSPPSDHSAFTAESTFAELQPSSLPSTSETATTGAGTDTAPAFLLGDIPTSAGDSKPSPDPSPCHSNSPIRRTLLRSAFTTFPHRNTVVSKAQKPGFVVGFKRKAHQSFRKFLEVFGVREKPTTIQSRVI